MAKSLDDELNDATAEYVKLTNEREIRMIVLNERKKNREMKNFTSYLEHSYITASHCFTNSVPYVNWLRAVDRQMKDDDDKIDASAVILEKFPIPRTDAGKQDWLNDLNYQPAMYFGKKLKVVFRDKNK